MRNIEILIGEKVRQARKRLGLTQTDLAKAAKASLTTINRLEKGKQFPQSDTLDAIVAALGMTIEDLTTGFSPGKKLGEMTADEFSNLMRGPIPKKQKENDDKKTGSAATLGEMLAELYGHIDELPGEQIESLLGIVRVMASANQGKTKSG